MRKLIYIIAVSVIFTACSASAIEPETERGASVTFEVSHITELKESEETITEHELRGIWVSQFDMHPIYRDGNKQRDKQDYENKVKTMVNNLKRDGFNAIFLQLRPNGDSMYESKFYPNSKYIAGTYGGDTEYDAVKIFLDIAKNNGFTVDAWINPFRLCREDELENHGKSILYDWYTEGLGKRIEMGDDGILYLDPSYKEATELIVSGAKEILEKYDFDGIHLDDYFYPTEFEFEDGTELQNSAYGDMGEFRRANINRTVKALYEAVHSFEGKRFGVAPAGNIYSLSSGWYVDIYKWLSEDGFVDYIMPQLYFGFENEHCPFEKVFSDWESALKNNGTKLYIGLSAAKCALGSEGFEDSYAGANGKYEWRDNKDILARSVGVIESSERAEGFCFFTYSSLYDPISGEVNPLTSEEMEAFLEVVGESS